MATVTFPASSQNALSWYGVFRESTPTERVPEGGASLALLGLGLAGLGAARRFVSKK